MADEKKKFRESLSKAEVIRASKLPEDKKLEYLKEIGAIQPESDVGKVPFLVYAKIKAIPVSLHSAMQLYPKAKGVKVATFEQWEEIFKSFSRGR